MRDRLGCPQSYFTYILECADGSYYVGSTTNLSQRVVAHNEGRGARWTAVRRPVRLVYSESHETEVEAVGRERQIKGWSRAKKQALIVGHVEKLKSLARGGDRL